MEAPDAGSWDGWVSALTACLVMAGGILLWTHRRAYERGRKGAVEKRHCDDLTELRTHIDQGLDNVRADFKEGLNAVHRRLDDHLNSLSRG